MTKYGMAAIVKGHESDMPAFQGILSDDQIHAILSFIKSRWLTKERQYQQQRNQAAAER